ncbi:MAG: hypothetical protein ACPGTP_03715, partial [Bacteroidia bacterium]
DPTDTVENWLVDGGSTATDPDTSLWGARQIGANWFNRTERTQKIWTGSSLISSTVQSVVISANAATVNAKTGCHFRITLDQNLSTLTLTPDRDGQKIVIEAVQDGTGSRTITWPSNVRFSTDIASGSFTPSSGAGTSTYFGLIYDSSVGKFDAVAVTKGFS